MKQGIEIEGKSLRKRRNSWILLVLAIVFVFVSLYLINKIYVNKTDSFIDTSTHKEMNALQGYLEKIDENTQIKYRNLLKAQAGSCIEFGSYEQDGNLSNGKEPIEWIVLTKEHDSLLVLSKFGLDCCMFNDDFSDVTWETCSLRKWLNDTFLRAAFNQEEQKMIQTSIVIAEGNPDYETYPGNDTRDKVFLVSMVEAENFFPSDESRQCQPTAYALSRKVFQNNSNCCYWLRTSGNNSASAAWVLDSGFVPSCGASVDCDDVAVRPMLRIFLSGFQGAEICQDTASPSAHASQAAECADTASPSLNKGYEIGSYVTFGNYPQEDGDKYEPIEWLILDSDENTALLLSKYGLDCQPYNTKDADVTWETCSLRKWLNETFFNSAFSQEERDKIQISVITADKNPNYFIEPGNDTRDKLFLLSVVEARKYFASDGARKCRPTAYAVKHNASKNTNTGCCWFWLRSPGNATGHATGVSPSGSVRVSGINVDIDNRVVRPALRIKFQPK